ncbi:MAG: NAD(+) synthase [Candidatus Methylarchaceae archaeon HK01M]|nr:NAD(+) synthase [Candidatus Methylarchaceae archaeon HK01M]
MPDPDHEKMIKCIQEWLRGYLEKSGAQGFVIGLSGGLDSSTTAVLCRRVTKNTLALLLPCDSSPQDSEDARIIAKEFDIQTKTYDLTPAYTTLLRIFGTSSNHKTIHNSAFSNIKPRLRMIVLYYVANTLNYLVVGTSNLTELALGYFTKYGDGGVDILPLGGLLKRDVRKIAEILEIPKKIICKPPSAGLWPGQTDEKELGASYEILDRVIANEDISDVDEGLVKRLNRMKMSNKHKRLPPPVCNL